MHVHIYIYNHSIPFGLILHMYPDRNRKNKSMAATGNNRHHVIALGSLPRVWIIALHLQTHIIQLWLRLEFRHLPCFCRCFAGVYVMFICICTYIYIFIYLYIYIYIYIFVHLHTCIHIYTYTYTNIYIYIIIYYCIFMYTHIHVRSICTYLYIYIHIHIHESYMSFFGRALWK